MADSSEREDSGGGGGGFSVQYRSTTTLLQTLSPARLGADRGEDSTVTVAVRVRPFSDRERRLGAKQCVFMNGNETSITHSNNGVRHRFVYDYSFWSTDSVQCSLATEEHVYKHLARPLLDWAFDGYNTCLFTYGQTGSGKSYTIMGEGQVVGIVPRFGEELFDRIEGTTDTTTHYKVEISYHEIYNEKIHDLLASNMKKSKVQLRVREHPVLGPYIEDLSSYVVSSFADIEYWLNVGNKYRATAATGMNDKSSRSHSVVTIILTQSRAQEGEEMSKVSKINLIDLAGSERSSVAQTTGDRLKEGGNINRSLHTLGKVIALLSERSSGKRKRIFIPYRDSTLTWLLKESLGGNSKTSMVATISPADIHYEESLSTLRYAQQARSIVNIAKVNEDPGSRLIRELRAEIERLRGMLSQAGDRSTFDTSSQQSELLALRSQLLQGEQLMQECTRSWKDKLSSAERTKQTEMDQLKKASLPIKVDNSLPNLVNLNEDPQLSEMLLYVINEGTTAIGQQSPSSSHDIQLTGALVAPDHCVIKNSSGAVSIEPSDENAQTYVNGDQISTPTILHHGDRVVVGGDHYFRLNHPVEVSQRGDRKSETGAVAKNFEFAKNELIEAQRSRLEAEVEEARLKERQKMTEELNNVRKVLEEEKTSIYSQVQGLQEELKRSALDQEEREQTQQRTSVKVSQLEEKNKFLEEETALQKRLAQLEKLRAQKEQEELQSYRTRVFSELEEEKKKLEVYVQEMQSGNDRSDNIVDLDDSMKEDRILEGSELLRISMMVQEANSISRALTKNITFLRDYVETSGKDGDVKFRVTNTRNGFSVYWILDKFEERLQQMRDLHQIYLEDGVAGQDSSEEDPFNHSSDGWEEAEIKVSGSSLSLFKKYPHLLTPLSPHVREHLLATITPLSSPLLKGKAKHGQQDSSSQASVMDSSAVNSYIMELRAGQLGRSESPLLSTFTSPCLGTYAPIGDDADREDVGTPLPVVKLCLDRISALQEEVKKLRKRPTRDAVTEVLRNSAKVSGAIFALLETVDNYSKLSKAGEVQVAMHETTDMEACCLAVSSSAELLCEAVTFLQREQDLLKAGVFSSTSQQEMDRTTELFSNTWGKLQDQLDAVVSDVSSVFQNVSRDRTEDVLSSGEEVLAVCSDLAQTLGSLATLRKVHCGPQQWSQSPLCLRDEDMWASEIPFETVQSYFVGVMSWCNQCLSAAAEKAGEERSREHVIDVNVSEMWRGFWDCLSHFMDALAAHQVSLWQSLLEHVSDGTIPAHPKAEQVVGMLANLYTLEHSVDSMTAKTTDRQSLAQLNSDFMSAFTQLATSSLDLVRSAQCPYDARITSQLQALSHDVMKSSKKLSAALKSAPSEIGGGRKGVGVKQGRRSTLDELLNDSTSGFEV